MAVPAVESFVAAHRLRHDPPARVGVPAHVTVAYPFTPADQLTEDSLVTLRRLVRRSRSFTLTLARPTWLDDDLLVLEPEQPGPLLELVAAVAEAFPDHPIYGGAHPDLRPHVTVARGAARAVLEQVERALVPHLPVRQQVTAVELWAGPALDSGRGPWAEVLTLPTG